ncbi:hypothetical protein HUU39_22320 [candidate division KSB1 bacterium]|nr:hypothetical protein [bacterium]NUM67970.1 hypothetical protein [candidate division KSB1 bacterium]
MCKSRLLAVLFLLLPFSMLHSQETQQDTLRELMRRIDILAEEIEKAKLGEVAERKYESRRGLGPAASQVYQLKKTGVSLAGYGEVTYQNFAKENDASLPSGKDDEIDYLRNIIYVGFRFSDRLVFNSEIEVEHGSTGKNGEVSMEFGYIEAQLGSAVAVRAGMVLPPVGIVNELHEPPTFHGSLRPEVEQAIIPSTWRTNGIGLVGSVPAGLGYRVYLVEGLNASQFSAGGIRGGRQSGSKSVAEDFGLTGRMEYTGWAGIQLGASFYTGNSGQDLVDPDGREIGARVNLFALHGLYNRHGVELRGLYAQSTIADAGRLNRALLLSGNRSIGQKQTGFYFTAAYDILPLFRRGATSAVMPFVQFERLDTQAEVPAGFSRNAASERTNLAYGITFKPHPNVACKADYLNRKNEAGTAVDQLNVALAYMF